MAESDSYRKYLTSPEGEANSQYSSQDPPTPSQASPSDITAPAFMPDASQEDNTDWGYLKLTEAELQPTSEALANSNQAAVSTGNLEFASIGALRQLVEHLNRERIKVQELMSSLSFALRSFNNVDQILELIPLVSSRIADASGAALVLFEDSGDVKISRMFCSEGGDCSRIKQALERAVSTVAAQFSNYSDSNSANKSSDRLSDLSSSISIEMADRFEQMLDEQVGLNLGNDVQLFGTSLLSRNVIRGRLYVFSHQSNYLWNDERQKLIRLVADQTAVAIENDLLNSELRFRARIAQEIAIGSEIQQRLQPQRCPTITGLDIAARSQSASPVGGDYYDFIQVPLSTLDDSAVETSTQPISSDCEANAINRWSIVIGDVMGKGVPAGLLMMATRGVLRAEVLHNREPFQILQHLNRVTYNDMENSSRFVSLFYSDFCPQTRQLRYSNAAHNPCLWWNAISGQVTTLDTDGMLIGVDSDSKYEQKVVQLNPNDVVLYYTDGVTEAVNPRGDRFEETGLMQALKSSALQCQSAQEILENLFEQVRLFRQGLEGIKFRDDMTVVVIKVGSEPNST